LKYHYPVDNLYSGSSLGNLFAFVQLDRESNLHGIWSSIDNSFYLGKMIMKFCSDTKEIPSQETIFEPLSQSTIYEGEGIKISKEVWLPVSTDTNIDQRDLQNVFVEVQVWNFSDTDSDVEAVMSLLFPAFDSPVFTKKPPKSDIHKKYNIYRNVNSLHAREEISSKELRVLFSEEPVSCVISNKGEANLRFKWSLPPHSTKIFTIVFVIRPNTEYDDRVNRSSSICENRPEKSSHHSEHILSNSEFISPSRTINRGIYWAKANMLRVQHRFRNGFGFTNDPPQDILVVRDMAWYVMGGDYFQPSFTRGMIDFVKNWCFHPDGKLTEYIHACEINPVLNDYGLNINDDTPLFIIALEHHALVSEESGFTEVALRLASRAADYILSQLREGLVYCNADGENVWGIASWRNIIDKYNLSGYVTEINVECCAALRATARLAGIAGQKSLQEKYNLAAESLEMNILNKLVDNHTGLFYLNIDKNGIPHNNVTGDLVFPVLFEIGDESIRYKIVKRLFSNDLWTDFGARTVANTDSTYHPERGMNLMGGIWPNLTAWFGMAAKDLQPERIVEAMEKIYRASEPDSPIDAGNLVPGEFYERLHGDDFKSMGMALSPWMPPTYLWLGIEGLLGLKVGPDFVRIYPKLPKEWNFLCVFNIPIKGRTLNVAIYNGVLYVDTMVQSNLPTKVGQFKRIENSCDPVLFEFSSENETRIFAFSERGFEGNVSLFLNSNQHNIRIKLNKNEMRQVFVYNPR
jgi:hypothetical protein